MLKVVVYDPLKANPTQEPLTLGQHELITVYNGEANWKDVLLSELRRRVGTVLVTGKHLIAFLAGDDILEISSRAPLLTMASICSPRHPSGNQEACHREGAVGR